MTAKQNAAYSVKARKRKLSLRLRDNWQMYVFLALPLFWLFLFKYEPMYGTIIAFKKYSISDGILGSMYVGLSNFTKFFDSYQFERVVGNTIYLSVVQMVLTFPIPIIFALMLNAVLSRKFKSAVENITYMPHFISTVVLVGILNRVLDINTGMINNLLALIDVDYDTNFFMGGPNFRLLYIASGVWQSTGWGSIIYMAALSGVDPELHEAATIDGASRFKRVWYIDLPTIIPTIAITLILRCGSLMSIGFDKAYLLQNDTNLVASEVISTYVYKVGLAGLEGSSNLSYATAIGMFNSVVNLVALLLVNKIADKVSGSGLW